MLFVYGSLVQKLYARSNPALNSLLALFSSTLCSRGQSDFEDLMKCSLLWGTMAYSILVPCILTSGLLRELHVSIVGSSRSHCSGEDLGAAIRAPGGKWSIRWLIIIKQNTFYWNKRANHVYSWKIMIVFSSCIFVWGQIMRMKEKIPKSFIIAKKL